MNKMNPERIDQLLDVWMADRDRGVMRTAAELCMESPELESELSRRIEVIGRFEKLASGGNQETLGSQGEIDTSHSANRPAPALPRKLTPMPASVGGFVPVEILGEGGMGAVYLAEDRQLGRCVAVKVMKKELAADLDARRRFLREARAMATIEHDNIMTIYAVGEDQETPFLVMPVLKGETLDDRLRRECTLSVAESCRISREIADGLAAAHAHGLIHRDIKPSNIWLEGKQGRVRILDFGLARPATDDQRVTQSGAVLGTPAYMAPEQAAGTDATSRSDLFSLGAVMYRMTTGEQPFAGPNMMATLNNLANKHPEAPRTKRPEIPEELSVLIQRLIAKDPEQRLESAADVRESLQQSFETRTSQATAVVPKTSEKPAVKVSAENAHMKPSSGGRSLGIPRRVIAGGLAGAVLLLAVVVYRIQTDHGTLIVTIDDDQVEAKLNKDGLVIEDAKTGRTWKLTPDKAEPMPSGEYKLPQVEGLLLNVRDDSGTEFKTAEFKIKRGDKITVLVTLATDGTSARKLSNADMKSATPDYAKEREIAEWILSIGGTVRVQFESGKVTTLTSQRAPEEKYVARIIKLTKNSQLTNKDLSRLTELSNLQELALTESQQINDTTAEIISRIQTLKSLDLSSTALTDVGISNIARLPQLTGLSIHATRVTDLGIAELAKVPTLRVLKATSCPISIAGLQSLSNLPLTELAVGSGYTKIQMSDLPEIAALFPKLRSFDGRLPGTSATGLSPLASLPDLSELMLRREDVVAGEPHQLASFPALKSLFIWHQKIPVTFFKELEQIAKVNHLTLQMCDLDDDAMDQFAKSTTIRQLSLFDWSGSDTELLKLVPMTQLRSLNLRNTKVTEAGAKKFHELRPDVAVTDDFNLPAAATPVVVPRDSCPLDSLDASQIPVQERSSDLPPETVAVLGSSHGKTWGSPFFTTHGNMSYSPDGKWICASDMTNVYLFDAATLNLRKRFAYVSQFLNHRWIAFSSDSRRLYVATQSNPQGSGNSMTDLTSPTLKTTTSGERFGGSYILANSPDDQLVAMDDNQIWWGPIRIGKRNRATGNISEMRAVSDIEGLPTAESLGRMTEVAFSPDGEWLITGHSPGGYRILRKENEEFVPVAVIPAQINQYNVRVAYSFTNDHNVALLHGADVCQQVDLSLPPEIPVPSDGLPVMRTEALSGVQDFSTSADGQTWAASQNVVGAPPVVLVGNWQNGIPTLMHTISIVATIVGHVALSPDGKSVAVMAENRVVRVFDLTQNPPVAATKTEYTISAVSSNSARAVTVGMSGRIQLEELGQDGARLLDAHTTNLAMYGAQVASDGKHAVTNALPDPSVSNHHRVQIWDIADGKLKEQATFEVSEDRAYCSTVFFAAGSRFLYGNQVLDLSIPSPKVVAEFSLMPAKPAAANVAADDQTIALASDDGALSIYRLDRPVDQPIASTQLPTVPTSMAFSPDGHRLVTTHTAGVCILWTVEEGQITESIRLPLPNIHGGMYHTTSSVFSGDGKYVYVASFGNVVEWKLDGNTVGRTWPLPGFTWLSRTDDGRHLIFYNSNCTTWILRPASP